MKECLVCGIKKELSEFDKIKNQYSITYSKKCSECRRESIRERRSKNKNKQLTYIYVITNPIYDGWVKIGRSRNVFNRIKNYQTYSPYRDFKLEYYLRIYNIDEVENIFYDMFGYENNEWFNIPITEAISIIERKGKTEL